MSTLPPLPSTFYTVITSQSVFGQLLDMLNGYTAPFGRPKHAGLASISRWKQSLLDKLSAAISQKSGTLGMDESVDVKLMWFGCAAILKDQISQIRKESGAKRASVFDYFCHLVSREKCSPEAESIYDRMAALHDTYRLDGQSKYLQGRHETTDFVDALIAEFGNTVAVHAVNDIFLPHAELVVRTAVLLLPSIDTLKQGFKLTGRQASPQWIEFLAKLADRFSTSHGLLPYLQDACHEKVVAATGGHQSSSDLPSVDYLWNRASQLHNKDLSTQRSLPSNAHRLLSHRRQKIYGFSTTSGANV